MTNVKFIGGVNHGDLRAYPIERRHNTCLIYVATFTKLEHWRHWYVLQGSTAVYSYSRLLTNS